MVALQVDVRASLINDSFKVVPKTLSPPAMSANKVKKECDCELWDCGADEFRKALRVEFSRIQEEQRACLIEDSFKVETNTLCPPATSANKVNKEFDEFEKALKDEFSRIQEEQDGKWNILNFIQQMQEKIDSKLQKVHERMESNLQQTKNIYKGETGIEKLERTLLSQIWEKHQIIESETQCFWGEEEGRFFQPYKMLWDDTEKIEHKYSRLDKLAERQSNKTADILIHIKGAIMDRKIKYDKCQNVKDPISELCGGVSSKREAKRVLMELTRNKGTRKEPEYMAYSIEDRMRVKFELLQATKRINDKMESNMLMAKVKLSKIRRIENNVQMNKKKESLNRYNEYFFAKLQERKEIKIKFCQKITNIQHVMSEKMQVIEIDIKSDLHKMLNLDIDLLDEAKSNQLCPLDMTPEKWQIELENLEGKLMEKISKYHSIFRSEIQEYQDILADEAWKPTVETMRMKHHSEKKKIEKKYSELEFLENSLWKEMHKNLQEAQQNPVQDDQI